jgi:hypothetical protein
MSAETTNPSGETMNSHSKSAAAAIIAGAVATVALGACGTTIGAAAAPPATASTGQTAATATISAAPDRDATTATAPAAAASVTGHTESTGGSAGRLKECKAGTLRLSFGGGDAGMSQQERVLRFTNTGSHTCAIVGFPGVSYVAGDDGHQVGAAAVRTGRIGSQIDLAPGAVASTVVHSADPGVFDPSTCKPTAVRGYRIYAPDDTAATFIALPGGDQACAGSTPEPALSVATIKAGPGNPDE